MVDPTTTVDLKIIPISALGIKLRMFLAVFLNATKIIPSPKGFCRDWRGICELAKVSVNDTESMKDDPTMNLLDILMKKRQSITFATFREMLGDIDRWDIFDDTEQMFLDDAMTYIQQKRSEHCITYDDNDSVVKNQPFQHYDALILYAEEDSDFADEVINKIEESGLRLCAKDRDFLIGLNFEHEAIRLLLTERCDRLVVILSPDFVRSKHNEYAVKLAQAIGIREGSRKIIPCVRMVDTTVDLKTIPLSALRFKSRSYLATFLDATKILPSSDGLSRDWRGIFHLAGLPNHYESFLSSKMSPTMELIKILEKEPHQITFAEYRKMLGDIDRWDVVDDTYELFVTDAVDYLKQQEKFSRSQRQLVNTSSTAEISPNQNCLTVDDVRLSEQNLPLQQYDAFILFADKDIDFATEMIEKVEAFGFKLCVKERDFLAGLSFEHDAIRHLLTERCDRLVVILSPDFVCSELNEYIANLAQSLGIAQRKRKIIPCLYKQCELPEIFRHIHLLNYQRSKQFYNFWDKLKLSLQTTPEERIANQCPQITLTDADRAVTSVISVPNDVQDSPVSQLTRNSRHQPSREFESLSTPHTPALMRSDSDKKFWPPSPKLRSSASMVNLTELDSAETNNNGMELRSKKPKWYEKLSHTLKLSPQNLKLSGSESNLSKDKSKSKKKFWRRIKVAS